jgi:hypothetical protein
MLTVVGMMALSGVARADEAAAVQVAEKFGGKIVRDEEQPGRPIIFIVFNGSSKEVTDAHLNELKE